MPIWNSFDTNIIKKSFELCGIQRHSNINNAISVDCNKLHSILRTILKHNMVIHSYISEEDDSDEAHLQFNENDRGLFEADFDDGTGEQDSDPESDDENMELKDGTQIEDRYTRREIEALVALGVATDAPVVATGQTASTVLNLNSQVWQHHVNEPINEEIGENYIVFTPPTTLFTPPTTIESNGSPNADAIPAQQSAPVATPQVRKRIRRTREQITAGITLEELRQMRAP